MLKLLFSLSRQEYNHKCGYHCNNNFKNERNNTIKGKAGVVMLADADELIPSLSNASDFGEEVACSAIIAGVAVDCAGDAGEVNDAGVGGEDNDIGVGVGGEVG